MKVLIKVSIGFPNAVRKINLEIDDEDFEGMNETEKQEYIEKLAWEEASQIVEMDWEIQ